MATNVCTYYFNLRIHDMKGMRKAPLKYVGKVTGKNSCNSFYSR